MMCLRKNPKQRPSAKDLLKLDVIREKMIELGFE